MNQDLVEQSKEYVKIMMVTMIPLGVILDVLAWRYRKLATLIVYYECFNALIQSFVPYDYGRFE